MNIYLLDIKQDSTPNPGLNLCGINSELSMKAAKATINMGKQKP